jgi:hypothetical protein
MNYDHHKQGEIEISGWLQDRQKEENTYQVRFENIQTRRENKGIPTELL